jgi:hypothetical protein
MLSRRLTAFAMRALGGTFQSAASGRGRIGQFTWPLTAGSDPGHEGRWCWALGDYGRSAGFDGPTLDRFRDYIRNGERVNTIYLQCRLGPFSTFVHLYLPPSTSIYLYLPLSTVIYHSLPFSAVLYHYLLFPAAPWHSSK